MDSKDMAGKTGNQKILEQFIADGFTYMFGNPGTVEQGFLDALADYPQLRYILSLQESVAVMMADGYARATKKPALVQLHSSPGIGNAVGALYQAKRGHAPLVCIGGDAGVKYLNMDAQMAADLTAIMEPVTKYATVVYDKNSILRTLRRAIKIATTPPMGPVYVCLPLDILSEINDEEVFPTHIPGTAVLPGDETISLFAKELLGGSKPVIFMGDGVAYSHAENELTRVAELLGAEVYGVDVGDFNMDTTHPLYCGTTGHMFGSASLPITRKADVMLIVGTYMLPEVFPELGNVYDPNARVIHIDLNAYEIAKNHRVDYSAVADPKLTLNAIAEKLEQVMTDADRQAAKKRTGEIQEENRKKLSIQVEKDAANRDILPMFMSRFMEELAPKLPEDAIIFDEALTNSPALTRFFPPKKIGSYFATRGGSLGVGFPGAIGVKLANPDKVVIGFSGDGGSMYTIQALSSATRHKIGAKFIVCSNGAYRLLQLNIKEYWKEQEINGREMPVPFDLSFPETRFDLIAQSMGVDAVRVESVEDIPAAITRMLADDKPFLIDLILEGDTHPHLVGVRCGQ
jgi:thiamine pyrophosphate-dependent acetolactate synthase large subunit-like protein